MCWGLLPSSSPSSSIETSHCWASFSAASPSSHWRTASSARSGFCGFCSVISALSGAGPPGHGAAVGDAAAADAAALDVALVDQVIETACDLDVVQGLNMLDELMRRAAGIAAHGIEHDFGLGAAVTAVGYFGLGSGTAAGVGGACSGGPVVGHHGMISMLWKLNGRPPRTERWRISFCSAQAAAGWSSRTWPTSLMIALS